MRSYNISSEPFDTSVVHDCILFLLVTVGHLLSSLPQARHHFHHHVEPNPEVDELRSLLREPHIQASYTPRTLLQLNSSNPLNTDTSIA